nr:ulp1 protease family, C-terminal catalytic domain-containing protein [Ipomoea batatas]
MTVNGHSATTSSPKDNLEESEQPPSGSEPDVNREDDEESAQPSAVSEPDVNTQEVEGNEDSESNEGRDTDTEYSDATYSSLSTRATPYQLTKHLQKLNDAQSQSLRDMGFDHLREQQISRVPGKLAWWLLNNFDARSCSLRVQDGKKLHITEEDVALTLGFPRGNIRIEKRTKGDEDTTLIEGWKKNWAGLIS